MTNLYPKRSFEDLRMDLLDKTHKLCEDLSSKNYLILVEVIQKISCEYWTKCLSSIIKANNMLMIFRGIRLPIYKFIRYTTRNDISLESVEDKLKNRDLLVMRTLLIIRLMIISHGSPFKGLPLDVIVKKLCHTHVHTVKPLNDADFSTLMHSTKRMRTGVSTLTEEFNKLKR